MEISQINKVFRNLEKDPCTDVDKKCEQTELEELYKKVNHVYMEKLLKLDELSDSTELRTKLLYLWVTDLLEQNASLVETVGELEQVAAERVLLLEDKLRKSSSSVQEYMAKAQVPDNRTLMSLQALVGRLEVDIGSLLELIRRARTEDCWDMRGLIFHEVSYWDIFGSVPPPLSVPTRDEPTNPAKNEVELQKLKAEVEMWRTRSEKAEAEMRAGGPVSDGRGSSPAADGMRLLQEQLDQARKLVVERAEQINSLTHRLDDTEQRSRDVQAVLTAEVAVKHDQVVHLRQRVQQLEEECRQASMQTHFRDEIIKDMRREVKRFRSQIALQRKKVMNLADYFYKVHEEAKELERKFEEPDLLKEKLALVPVTAAEVTNGKEKVLMSLSCRIETQLAEFSYQFFLSEDSTADDVVQLLTLAMSDLMELTDRVDKVVKDTADQARRHRDTQVHNMLNTLRAMKSRSSEATNLRLEVSKLKRQLDVAQTRLQSAQEEVTKKEKVIAILTDAAKVRDSMVSERESRIRACEKEIARNEEIIRSLTSALAEQTERSGVLREVVVSTRQQLQQLEGDASASVKRC